MALSGLCSCGVSFASLASGATVCLSVGCPGERLMRPPANPVPVAEPIIGYRVWTVRRDPAVTLTRDVLLTLAAAHEAGENPWPGLLPEARLWPLVTAQAAWERVEHAICAQMGTFSATWTGGPGSHPAPAPRCHCGLWALRTLDAARVKTIGVGAPYAVGSVELWGRVLEHDDGWRAEHARPVDIALIHGGGAAQEWADELAAFYGCNVTVEKPGVFDPATLLMHPATVLLPTTTSFTALAAKNRVLLAQNIAQKQASQLAMQLAAGQPPPKRKPWWYVYADRLAIGAILWNAIYWPARALGWL